MRNEFDFTPQERAAILTWHLSQGGVLTAEQAARMTGLQHTRSAGKLLAKLARVLPITCTEDGVWHIGVAREKGNVLDDVLFEVKDLDVKEIIA